jgi:hypothetical protein
MHLVSNLQLQHMIIIIIGPRGSGRKFFAYTLSTYHDNLTNGSTLTLNGYCKKPTYEMMAMDHIIIICEKYEDVHTDFIGYSDMDIQYIAKDQQYGKFDRVVMHMEPLSDPKSKITSDHVQEHEQDILSTPIPTRVTSSYDQLPTAYINTWKDLCNMSLFCFHSKPRTQ